MRAFRKKRGFVNWDWCFGVRMETSSMCEKDTKRKNRRYPKCTTFFMSAIKLCNENKLTENQPRKCSIFDILKIHSSHLFIAIQGQYRGNKVTSYFQLQSILFMVMCVARNIELAVGGADIF